MVQSTYPNTVPEELYNLTQLADVTLAAGKLSTTNIHQIKEYIQSDDIQIDPPSNKCTTKSKSALLNTKIHHSTNCIKSEDDTIFNNYHTPNTTENIEMNNIDSDNNIKTHSVIKSTICLSSEFPHMCETRKNLLTPSHKAKTSLLSSSSSEDDSTYQQYSHKIFDKRRVRKLSFQSDDSGLDIYNNRSNNFNSTTYFNVSGIRETDDSLMSNSETDSTDYADACKTIDANGDDVHVCPECSKKYSTSSNLARHRQTHRSLMDKKARRCPHCDKVYVSMPAFSMHVRTHNQGCECPHCGKRFSRPWLLQGHIRTHTGEKPFQCSICAKAFADKSNLRAHVQTHSNTKPHTCGRCGKAFALKSYLYKHEESSCMRNHTIKPTYDRSISSNSNSGTSSNKSSKTSTNNIIAKIMKKNRSSLTSDSNKLNLNKDKVMASNKHTKIIQESIVMDYGSQKSYIDLTTKTAYPLESPKEHDNFSRISVIRSALSATSDILSTNIPSSDHHHHHQSSNISTYDDDLSMGFYQEKPMDFSPKNKLYQNSGNQLMPNKFEVISRNYSLMV